MPQTSVKFTVIIPTRERANTLYHCLRTVTAQDYGNLTILVSDNDSQDNTRDVVLSFSDPRIKYINTTQRISMSHNFEFALQHVQDGWVTVMGDDDGLLPGALRTVADAIGKSKSQALISRLCIYNWPDSEIARNTLVVPLSSGIELRDTRPWLNKLMQGEANYSDLPYLYTGGFVNSAIIKRAHGADGQFYHSLNPDVYSAIALASVLDRYAVLLEPIAVGGTSSYSTGASNFYFQRNTASVQKFFSEDNIPFHQKLPNGELYKSLSIMIYECYLQSEHLHHDFLKIYLEDQLGLALSRATPRNYRNLRNFCQDIASKHGVAMNIVDRKANLFKRRLCWHRLRKIYWHLFKQRVISCDKFSVEDVYGASILAKTIFLLDTQYNHKTWNNLRRLLDRFSI